MTSDAERLRWLNERINTLLNDVYAYSDEAKLLAQRVYQSSLPGSCPTPAPASSPDRPHRAPPSCGAGTSSKDAA